MSFLLWADDPDRVLGIVQGHEEREALDVIPVEVRQKDMNGVRASLDQVHAQRTNPRAGVEDDALVCTRHLETRRIPTVPDRVGARRGDRPSGPPAADGDIRGRGIFRSRRPGVGCGVQV